MVCTFLSFATPLIPGYVSFFSFFFFLPASFTFSFFQVVFMDK